MPQEKRKPSAPLGVILLAAGYGTRLTRDLISTQHFSSLAGTPKPLLPLAGRTILDHWIESLSAFPSVSLTVVTNAAHEVLYATWAGQARRERFDNCDLNINVVSDASTSNENRLGAVADIEIGLKELEDSGAQLALIIAGDTLLPGTDIHAYVTQFQSLDYPAAAFAYQLNDIRDCNRRGMFQFQESQHGVLVAKSLVEKPATPAESPSDLASAPVYILQRSVWNSVSAFLQEAAAKNEPLECRDAPGFWLRWLIPKHDVILFRVAKRIDIGGLAHYKDALWDYTVLTEAAGMTLLPRSRGEAAVGRAFPRIGLLGNPSDGYAGKVIAASIASEGFAEVVATAFDKFVISPNANHELHTDFTGLDGFLGHIEERGIHFGARSLVMAASVIFARVYKEYYERENAKPDKSHVLPLNCLPNCQLTYSTTIPARIGLSGSSALILATLRALSRFHDLSLKELNPEIKVWPVLIRSAELDLLGISCGLMDRVVQVLQGCVAMDFSDGGDGLWEHLPEKALPEMWIAYSEKTQVGESSGKVHGNLRGRFLAKDPAVLKIVEQLCDVTDAGKALLERKSNNDNTDMNEFASLVRKNFELRLALVGKDAIGNQNLNLVSVAKKAGFAAKMTGSGGCALCLPDPVRSLTKEEVDAATKAFQENELVLRRITVLERHHW